MSDLHKTSIQHEELWEFPMHYPVKIMGEACHPMVEIITTILQRHAASFDASTLEERTSSGGKYISITATVYVTCKEQINGMYADFASCKEIRMVL